jgi:serine/threonine protein kinase
VKGANILLNMKGEVKLTDFGVSDALGGSSDMIGSPYWMAPEVVQERPYDSRCDVW